MSPTYAFFCGFCGHTTESFYQMKDLPESILCEKCQQIAQQTINCENGFQLKGTGWERDRYTGASNRRWLGGKPHDE